MTVPLALVVNPAAGGGRPARYLPVVAAVLDAAGAPYTVRESTSLENARALAATASARGETVVAFGGDGLTGALAGIVAKGAASGAEKADSAATDTASGATDAASGQGAVSGATDTASGAEGVGRGQGTHGEQGACGVQDTHPGHGADWRSGAFGVIPAGRGNDFARTLGIPFEPAAAARVLLGGEPRPVDLIAVTGAGTHPMPIIVAGSVYVGIASVAGEIANRARLIRGPLVYNLAALRALLGWKPTTFRVDTTGSDGQRSSDEFAGYAVVVANLPYFGAGMKVAPEARCGDGLLDIVIMRHGPKLTFIRALMKIKDGSHVTLAQVSTLRAATADVTADRPLPVGADGESLPASPPLRIRALPAALTVIVPRLPGHR